MPLVNNLDPAFLLALSLLFHIYKIVSVVKKRILGGKFKGKVDFNTQKHSSFERIFAITVIYTKKS